jgi:hypothetical protein
MPRLTVPFDYGVYRDYPVRRQPKYRVHALVDEVVLPDQRIDRWAFDQTRSARSECPGGARSDRRVFRVDQDRPKHRRRTALQSD